MPFMGKRDKLPVGHPLNPKEGGATIHFVPKPSMRKSPPEPPSAISESRAKPNDEPSTPDGPPNSMKDPVVTLTFRGQVLQMSGPGALSEKEFFQRLSAAMSGPIGLAALSPAQRAVLTQEQLDGLMLHAIPSYRDEVSCYRVTLDDLRRYEPFFAQPLPAGAPPSHEWNLWLQSAIEAKGKSSFKE